MSCYFLKKMCKKSQLSSVIEMNYIKILDKIVNNIKENKFF